MKKLLTSSLIFVLLLHISLLAKAQYITEFYLTDLDKPALKEAVQTNVTNLLTEINNAYSQKRLPDFSKVDISLNTQNTIRMLWANTPFRCGETEVIERCLKMADGYQVRNIPLLLLQPGEEKPQYQEGVIGFNTQGQITDFHLAISTNLYTKILKDGQAVSDFRYRQMILDYVEQFRTAYSTKDLPFLTQIFSDDALIITGKIIKSVPSEMNHFMASNKVVYTKQTKKEYLGKLKGLFSANKRINVNFDDIKIMKHPAKEGFYGVTLKQGYSSDKYSDEGYLFLLWDFTNEDAPKIHVRTWQPEMLSSTKRLPEEEIFTCDDFDIQ